MLLPVLVCQDGFTITHSAEPVTLLPDAAVRRFVGDYSIPHAVLDVARPTTQGPFAMPDYYYEFRRQQAAAIEAAATVFGELASEFACCQRPHYGEIEEYRLDGAPRASSPSARRRERSRTSSTSCARRASRVGLLKFTRSAPSPPRRSRQPSRASTTIVVLDRADSPGATPPLHAEVAAALYGSGCELSGAVYGLGGRDLHPDRHPRRLRRRAPPPHRPAR